MALVSSQSDAIFAVADVTFAGAVCVCVVHASTRVLYTQLITERLNQDNRCQ